jgi:multidrug resistance protein, MATE family
MGVYMQRSWIVLFMCAVLAAPAHVVLLQSRAEELLLLTGQSPELSKKMAGQVSVWFIPLHFSFALLCSFPLQRFLQCQMNNFVNAAAALCIHIFVSWLFISKYQFGLVGIALTLNFSWWAIATLLFAVVLNTVDNFSVLLAFTILHNSIQPILSGELFPCMGL